MTLDYLILLRLSELEKGMAAKSTFLTEKINEKIMTTAFSQKAITGRLRALHNKGFVKKNRRSSLVYERRILIILLVYYRTRETTIDNLQTISLK